MFLLLYLPRKPRPLTDMRLVPNKPSPLGQDAAPKLLAGFDVASGAESPGARLIWLLVEVYLGPSDHLLLLVALDLCIDDFDLSHRLVFLKGLDEVLASHILGLLGERAGK